MKAFLLPILIKVLKIGGKINKLFELDNNLVCEYNADKINIERILLISLN